MTDGMGGSGTHHLLSNKTPLCSVQSHSHAGPPEAKIFFRGPTSHQIFCHPPEGAETGQYAESSIAHLQRRVGQIYMYMYVHTYQNMYIHMYMYYSSGFSDWIAQFQMGHPTVDYLRLSVIDKIVKPVEATTGVRGQTLDIPPLQEEKEGHVT